MRAHSRGFQRTKYFRYVRIATFQVLLKFNAYLYCLVQPDENIPRQYRISGVLDFAGVDFNCYVFEIAIAICYMMIDCKSMDILDAPGHVLAGYNRLRPLPEKEFFLLKVSH